MKIHNYIIGTNCETIPTIYWSAVWQQQQRSTGNCAIVVETGCLQ